LESYQRLLRIAEIAYDLAQRLGEFPHQCRNCYDLVPGRELRMLNEVNDLYVVTSRQMFLAQVLEIRESSHGARRLSRHIQAQLPYLVLFTSASRSIPGNVTEATRFLDCFLA
jgi:plasmid stabilization system protein ParE